MRLSGAKTILHITEVNGIEREMLKALGFLKSGESDGCEYWEYSVNFSKKNEVAYQKIGSNLILGSDGSVFIKLRNGYYTDKDRNEYRYNNNKLVPVLIRNNHLPETTEFKITDAMNESSDWKKWKVGRKTVYETHEFDGNSHIEGIITEVHEDHLICEAEGMHLWIDDDTADMFS